MDVFGNDKTLTSGENETAKFEGFFNLFNIADKCRPLMRDLFCRYFFPLCDTSLDKPKARQICRRTCEYLDQELCKAEMIDIKEIASNGGFDMDLIDCSLYVDANGGDAPECYQYYPLSGRYFLKGLGHGILGNSIYFR